MIKASFARRSSGDFESVELSGHAGSGEYGFDIVCAAASTLAINLVNSLESLAGCSVHVDLNDKDGGYMRIDLSQTNKLSDPKVQLLFASFLLGMTNLADNAADFVTVIEN